MRCLMQCSRAGCSGDLLVNISSKKIFVRPFAHFIIKNFVKFSKAKYCADVLVHQIHHFIPMTASKNVNHIFQPTKSQGFYFLVRSFLPYLTASFIKMTRGLTRVLKLFCLELRIACSYFLTFLRRNIRVPIGQHVAP